MTLGHVFKPLSLFAELAPNEQLNKVLISGGLIFCIILCDYGVIVLPQCIAPVSHFLHRWQSIGSLHGEKIYQFHAHLEECI